MIETSKTIVLSTIKYGDTSLIASCYTERFGIKSFILKGILKSRKGKIKPAYFQPLTLLNTTANFHYKNGLIHIKEASVYHFYATIYTDIKKQSIALFLAEVLHHAIKEEEQNELLFQYLETAFLWLDTHENVTNFHLLFLLNLTKYLGFYPEVNTSLEHFDMLEGTFTNTKSNFSIENDKLNQFKKLLGINFDAIHQVKYNAEQRQTVLNILIQYFELHLTGFKKPKSLNVLKTIFS
jgi:DNA repair protein RecO (recombination protein O)